MDSRRKGPTYGKPLRRPAQAYGSSAVHAFAEASDSPTTPVEAQQVTVSASSSLVHPKSDTGQVINFRVGRHVQHANHIMNGKPALAAHQQKIFDSSINVNTSARGKTQGEKDVGKSQPTKKRKLEVRIDGTTQGSQGIGASKTSAEAERQGTDSTGNGRLNVIPEHSTSKQAKAKRSKEEQSREAIKTRLNPSIKPQAKPVRSADNGLVPRSSQDDEKQRQPTEIRARTPRSESQSPRMPTASLRRPFGKKADKAKYSVSTGTVARPATPVRSMKTHAAAITPKQVELFSKLLSGTPKSVRQSPCSEMELDNSDLPATKSAHSSDGSLSPRRLSTSRRSARLIDSLDPSGILGEEDDETEEEVPMRALFDDVDPNQPAVPSATSSEPGPASPDEAVQLISSQRVAAPISSTSLNHRSGPKVTYAQQRSYLSDQVPATSGIAVRSVASTSNLSRQLDTVYLQEPSAPSFEFDGEFDFEDGPDSQSGAMRSVRELREAGGNRRLLQEFEANLEDLNQRQRSFLPARRSALISLAEKLLESSNRRLFIDHCLQTKLVGFIDISKDPLERLLLLCLMLELLANGSSRPLIAVDQEPALAAFWEFLASFLYQKDGIVDNKQICLPRPSKHVASDFERLSKSILKMPVWQGSRPDHLSGQSMALQCVEIFIRQIREAGYVGALPPKVIAAIVGTSISMPGKLQPPSRNEMACSTLAISILESCTVLSASDQEDFDWPQTSHEHLREFLCYILGQTLDALNRNRLNLLLRLHLNLTNRSNRLCSLYATLPVVDSLLQHVMSEFQRLLVTSSEVTKNSGQGDSLLLSLGCLINFADRSGAVRSAVLQLQSSGRETLATLLGLFQRERKRAADVCAHILYA